jgi:hypothetical protein
MDRLVLALNLYNEKKLNQSKIITNTTCVQNKRHSTLLTNMKVAGPTLMHLHCAAIEPRTEASIPE